METEDSVRARRQSTGILPSRAELSYGLRANVIVGPARGTQVSIGPAGVSVGSGADNQLVLDDAWVSRHHLALSPHPAGVRVRDLESRNGTFVSGTRIFDAVVPPGATISAGRSEVLLEPDQGPHDDMPLTLADRLGGLIGRSPAMRRIFTILERAAPTDYTILVEGETGTGKEVVARTVHEISHRRAGPFVILDSAGTAESLIESEVFGHVRGAFTGAVASHEGAFRRAHGGSLFIDELSSLPLQTQGKLLRVLETRRVRPVGGDREQDVDLRVVAASNRPLYEDVRAGRFRDDLYFRMSVVRVQLPPLRERREDIPLLVEHFLRSTNVDGEVAGPNLDRLVGYSWPGNVRELRNTLERAIALTGARRTFAELPVTVGDPVPTTAWPMSLDLSFKQAKERLIDTFERVYLTQLLARSHGNISAAAARAHLSRRHLFELLRQHQLGRPPVTRHQPDCAQPGGAVRAGTRNKP
jgi:DNA-binding NtrC family response regulator